MENINLDSINLETESAMPESGDSEWAYAILIVGSIAMAIQ
jgi:hypothetical protein